MKLMILDGNSVINRAYFGVRPLTTRDGLYTNAIYGFLNILEKMEREEQPEAICVAFDVHAPTFRHLQYDGYKATRHPMPEELVMQMPVMKQVLSAMNIPIYECEGWEADDVIGTVGRVCSEQNWDCVVVTGDRDSLQLINDHVNVKLVIAKPGQTTATLYDTEKFRAEYGFDPIHIIDLKALMGDSSDNIPGVAGVGPKTATDLLLKFGTLDGVYEHLQDPSIRPKLREKLEADKEKAYHGELMAIPAPNLTAGGVNEMWIRQDWLDALGLDVPRTWDELAEVAKAFVTRDPDGNGENDTIGILGPGNSDHMNAVGGNQFGLDPLFSCFQSYPQYWLKSEDGSVEYGSIQPETKTALENISKLYADGVIDPETLVRSDSKEPLLAGKVGIFFGPWWCAYTFADTTLSGSADWRAYFTPLSEDGKYYTHMAEPTTQYVVASKDCKNPEAAFKIINYLVANEQKWVEEGVTSTEMGTGDFYPLYNTYDNADEIEKSYEALTKYLAGDISMDDVDFSTHKLLKNDMEAVTKLKKKPYDDFSLKYWNLDSDLAKTNLPRLVAIMVGDAPLVNEEYVPVYNAYNGQTETMEAKWANLKKMEEETFAKIIMGKADISEFDTFVKNWKNQGGDQILKEINDELSK